MNGVRAMATVGAAVEALLPLARSFVLDSRALAMGHASPFLAIAGDALGQTFALDSPPATARSSKTDGVAVLDIRGPLAQRAEAYACEASVDGYDAIEARFNAALADPEVSAIMLRIDSPGGDCAGLYEAVGRMQRARDASGKHVAAFFDEKACSAAYCLAMVASPGGISLPASAITASIGVLNAHEDASEALAAAGRKWTIIRSGPRKAEASSVEPLTDAARDGMQGMVDALAAQFFDIVAKARGMSVADLRASGITDGHVVMGREAVRLGLADKVQGWDDALARAAKEGRKAQKERRMKAINTALGIAADAPESDTLAAIERLKTEAATAKALTEAKAAEAAQAAKDLAAEKLKADIGAAIDSAIAAKKIPPSAHARATGVAYAAKHGLEALRDHYAGMPEQPALAGSVGREEKSETGKPEATVAYEGLTPMERHRLQQSDPDAYAASKADWEARGKPIAAIKPAASPHHPALAERN